MSADDEIAGHEPCGAKTRSGGPCVQVAGYGTDHVGIGRCKFHGGSTPNHERSAQLILAERACDRLGIPIETDGVQALTNRLWETEGDLAFYRAQVQSLGEDVIDTETGPAGAHKQVPHAMIVLYHEAEERNAKIAAACIKAGIEEAQLRIDQVKAQEVFRCVMAALTVMDLAGRFEEFRHAFADAIRSGPVLLGAS